MPSSGDLPDPGIKPGSPALQADSLPTELSGNSSLASEHTKCPIYTEVGWCHSRTGLYSDLLSLQTEHQELAGEAGAMLCPRTHGKEALVPDCDA